MRQRKLPLGNRNLIGQNVTTLRMKAGLSQSALLSRLELQGSGMDQSRLSNIEGQKTIVSDIELVAIAKALDVSVMNLLFSE